MRVRRLLIIILIKDIKVLSKLHIFIFVFTPFAHEQVQVKQSIPYNAGHPAHSFSEGIQLNFSINVSPKAKQLNFCFLIFAVNTPSIFKGSVIKCISVYQRHYCAISILPVNFQDLLFKPAFCIPEVKMTSDVIKISHSSQSNAFASNI